MSAEYKAFIYGMSFVKLNNNALLRIALTWSVCILLTGGAKPGQYIPELA